MNIGIDARQLSRENPAGVGIYLRKILRCFSQMDDNNIYFLYSNKPILCKEFLQSNKFRIRIIRGKIGTLAIRYAMNGYIRKDNIQIFWGPEHIVPCKCRETIFVVTIHDLALVINRKWGASFNSAIQNLFLKSSIKDADKIIAISQCTKKDLISLYKINEEKIEVIYNGGEGYGENVGVIDKKKEMMTFTRYHIDNPYFIFVGTIEPRKNIELVINGFEQYCKDNSEGNLLIVGKLGWKYKKIVSHIYNSRVKDRIIYCGYVTEEEKIILLKNSRALVFPSHYEGFGLPVIEAMSLKVPVITNRESSLGEVGGNAAFYLKGENDKKELARKLEKCMRMSAEERNQIGKKCAIQAEKFKWRECAYNTYNAIMDYGRSNG